jgi:methyltransferase family protein
MPFSRRQGSRELDHPHKTRRQLKTSDIARSIADDVAPLTTSGTGNISRQDGYFLLSLIELSRPAHILEVGVASGTSTLMLLRMIDRIAPDTTLLSIDLASEYYADQSKPVGYLVGENYEIPSKNWKLLTQVGAMSFAQHPEVVWEDQRRYYDLVFVDAHHGHPWPTFDALCVLPFCVPGTWIALHDINLPLLGDYPFYGAVHVVQDWPLDVVVSDQEPIPNTGAIRLSDAAEHDVARLVRVLDRPWDCGVHSFHAHRIFGHLKTFLSREHLRAVRDAFERNSNLEVQ